MPSEVYVFLISVLLVTVQFEIQFFTYFHKNAEFRFTFFLSYVLARRTLLLGEGARATNHMSPNWISVGKNIFPC
jgi:hypothetical protein